MNNNTTDLAQHINLRLSDGRVITHTTAQRRQLARCVLRQGVGALLLVFRLVDAHLHLEVAGARAAAGQLVRRLKIALWNTLKLPIPFERAHYEPIRNQRHLVNTADYILRQEKRHGVELDPYFEASNLPDLLGLRLCGAYTKGNVSTYLPRLKQQDLLNHLEPRLRDALLSVDQPTSLGVLPDAAAAALGLPSIEGRGQEVVAARRAIVEIATPELTSREIADMLRTTERNVRRLRTLPLSEELVLAVNGQLRLRQSRP